MRLMLGTEMVPRLLVTVRDNYNPDLFEFDVVNGYWEGRLTNGFLTVVNDPCGARTYIDQKLEILCDNQDRLRGDYNDVFNNFHDETYVGESKYQTKFDNMDDDIAF